MKIIKHSLARKIFLCLAISWTLVIAYLCLISFKELPTLSVQVDNMDKWVHFALHFVFTSLWFLGLKSKEEKGLTLVLKVFAASLSYGIAIEISQWLFTTTRNADIKDVMANSSGSIAAIFTILFAQWIFNRKIKN